MIRRYLWSLVEGKLQRYGRCRQCYDLVLEYDEDGHFVEEALRPHLGHTLDNVSFVGPLEFLRIIAS